MNLLTRYLEHSLFASILVCAMVSGSLVVVAVTNRSEHRRHRRLAWVLLATLVAISVSSVLVYLSTQWVGIGVVNVLANVGLCGLAVWFRGMQRLS
jgi:uncharacterized membrane protein